MSIIDNLKGKAGAKAPPSSAAAIEARLNVEREKLLELDAALTEAALAANADPSLRGRYDALRVKIDAAHDDVALLERAYQGALARDNAASAARRAEQRRENISAIKRHIKARNEALAEMEDALGKAAKAFARALEKCEQAYALRPDDIRWPDEGTLISFGELRQLWVAHLYKISAKPGGERALPGSAEPDANYTWQPDAIPSIAIRTKQATDHLFALLDGPIEAHAV